MSGPPTSVCRSKRRERWGIGSPAIGLQEPGGVVMPAFFTLNSLDMLRW